MTTKYFDIRNDSLCRKLWHIKYDKSGFHKKRQYGKKHMLHRREDKWKEMTKEDVQQTDVSKKTTGMTISMSSTGKRPANRFKSVTRSGKNHCAIQVESIDSQKLD